MPAVELAARNALRYRRTFAAAFVSGALLAADAAAAWAGTSENGAPTRAARVLAWTFVLTWCTGVWSGRGVTMSSTACRVTGVAATTEVAATVATAVTTLTPP